MAHPLAKFLRQQQLLTNAVTVLTRKTGTSMASDIDTLERLGELSAAQKLSVRNSLNGKLEDHFEALQEEIEDDRIPVAEVASEISAGYVSDSISEAIGPKSRLPEKERLTTRAIRNIEQSMITSQRGSIDAAVARMQGRSYVPLSRKVYKTRTLVKGQVSRMINYHLAKGSSGHELARDIRQFVRPSVPGGLNYASLRLGRTELNNAFHAVSIDQAKKNPYVTGMTWHTSGGHPRPDRCDDYDQQTFKLHEVPDKPHPNCFCYVTPETISDKQFLDHYRKGDFTEASADDAHRPGMGDIGVGNAADMANGSAEKFLVRNADGSHSFTADRQALHDRIVESSLAGKIPVARPQYNVLGGGGGSGKTTLIKSGRVPLLTNRNSVMVNADDIKEKLPDYVSMNARGDKRAAAYVHEESSYLAKRTQAAAFERGLNVTLDGTGDGKLSGLQGKIQAGKDAGYTVNGIYVTVPSDVAVARAEARGARTGRFVPETVLRRTHAAVSDIYGKAYKDFDTAEVFDMSERTPNRLSTWDGSTLKISDSAGWEAFLAKAKE